MNQNRSIDSAVELNPSAIAVREIGSFHVGGSMHTLSGMAHRDRMSTPGGAVHSVDPNGEILAGQMYVQYVRLASPRSPHPLLLWHGGGMTGATWETTPDGRHGWQMFFLRAGFDVYVSDAAERGRSSWAPFPEVYAEAPYFRTGREAWEDVFRFGPPGSWHADPVLRRAHEGMRFPTRYMDTFMKQFVPRWATNNTLTQEAYDALIAHLDSGVVMTHSQGGNFGLTTALHAPERVKAVISIEPSDAPDPRTFEPGSLRGVPHLFVWGDFLSYRPSLQRHSLPNVRAWSDALVTAGVDVEWIDLPSMGIKGNSHALMSDDNSDDIAGLVLDWLKRHDLAT
jgi:pimeloyl-ACP methyl ester carboxylesterase